MDRESMRGIGMGWPEGKDSDSGGSVFEQAGEIGVSAEKPVQSVDEKSGLDEVKGPNHRQRYRADRLAEYKGRRSYHTRWMLE